MRTRNLAKKAPAKELAPKVPTTKVQGTSRETLNKDNVLKLHNENSPAKTRSGRSRVTNSAKTTDSENIEPQVNQPNQRNLKVSQKRTRGGKNSENAVVEVVQLPQPKKSKVEQVTELQTPATTTRTTRNRDKTADQETPPIVERRSNRKHTQVEVSSVANKNKEDAQPSNSVRTRRGRKENEVVKEKSPEVEVKKLTEERNQREDHQKRRITGRRKDSEREGPGTQHNSVMEPLKSAESPDPSAPVSSLKSIAIPKPPPVPEPSPVQRSPVYLSSSKHDSPVTSALQPSGGTQKSTDTQFCLMPLPRATNKKTIPKKKTTPQQQQQPAKILPRTAPVTIAEDDVFGMDFNDSSEPPPNKKTTKTQRRKAQGPAKPRQPKGKKPVEPSGLKLWDEKDLVLKQRQIKLNVLHKDFKHKEKPIPLPVVQQQRPRPPPSVVPLNSTAKVQSSTSSSSVNFPVQITGISNETSSNPLNTSSSGGGGANGSRLMPWRYSTIRHVSMSSFLNDSNAENVNPAVAVDGKSAGKNSVLGTARPLHTLQPQRSPMKELHPNETIPVPRPNKSPAKRHFGVENNFGFEDSDQEENEEELLKVKKNIIQDKIDSLKKFRHSLNVSQTAASPIPGPMRAFRTQIDGKQPKKIPVTRNIFTSTPQQVKIRDAFKASTPIAGPSKHTGDDDDVVVAGSGCTTTEKEGTDQQQLKLFESLTFEAPPKRNYSMLVPKRKKRVDFYGYSDDDASEDEKSQDDSLEPPRAKQAKKSKVHQVQEEKLAKFVDEFNSMCEEVDQYELVIE